MQTTLPLGKLRYGHEAVPPINARKVGRDEEIAPLKASIAAHGLGQALNVKLIDEVPFVSDGNRRLKALFMLRDDGALTDDSPIIVNIAEGDGDAEELSLALNIQRLPMHEADQYVKFQDMRTQGMTEEQIGSRFGIETARVRRMIALGRLHPDILDAWRNDEFNRPGDVVKAFTMAPSQKAQKEAFDQLKKKGWLDPHRIREAFGAGNSTAVKLLKFVGQEAYEAAGGKVTRNLFDEDVAVSDFDLLSKCADERLARELEQLVKDGWAWAEQASELPSGYSYNWEKIRPKLVDPTDDEAAEIKKLTKLIGKKGHWEQNDEQRAAAERIEQIQQQITVRSYTAKDKKKSGVAAEIAHTGALKVTYGLKKPMPKKAEKPKPGEPAAAAVISNALAMRLSVQMALAAKEAIKVNPHTALAAVLAGLGSSGYGLPIMVKTEGNVKAGRQHENFDALLGRYLQMPTEDLLVALANEAGDMVHFHTNYAAQPILASKVHSNLVEALEPGALQDALRARFDGPDYFQTSSKPFALAAITESLGEQPTKIAATMKKGDLVAFCIANVVPTGWLPPELRTRTYAPPTPPKAAAAAEAPPAKATPKTKAAQKSAGRGKAAASPKPTAKAKSKPAKA